MGFIIKGTWGFWVGDKLSFFDCDGGYVLVCVC